MHLVLQDTQGFPRVERDLLQVEQYSQQLKARAARIDPAGDALAATRLLAQEGLNTRKCGLLSYYTVCLKHALAKKPAYVGNKPVQRRREEAVCGLTVQSSNMRKACRVT